MANIKLIIWDFDGVMVDSEYIAGQATVKLLAEFGMTMSLDDILRKFVGMHGDQMVQFLGQAIGQENIDKYKAESRIRNKAAFTEHLTTLPYVDQVMAQLKLPMCIGSNSSLTSLLYKLKITNMAQYFPEDKLFVGAMFDHPKPAPDMYLHAAKTHGLAPNECLVIEDSVAGTTAAVAAGMPVIGYYGASHCYAGYENKLTDAGSLTTFNDMRELHDIMKNL